MYTDLQNESYISKSLSTFFPVNTVFSSLYIIYIFSLLPLALANTHFSLTLHMGFNRRHFLRFSCLVNSFIQATMPRYWFSRSDKGILSSCISRATRGLLALLRGRSDVFLLILAWAVTGSNRNSWSWMNKSTYIWRLCL